VAARFQREVAEIGEVLARRQGKTVRKVRDEVLTLHRVLYEIETLLAEDSKRWWRAT
jgi:hypothetical protein